MAAMAAGSGPYCPSLEASLTQAPVSPSSRRTSSIGRPGSYGTSWSRAVRKGVRWVLAVTGSQLRYQAVRCLQTVDHVEQEGAGSGPVDHPVVERARDEA